MFITLGWGAFGGQLQGALRGLHGSNTEDSASRAGGRPTDVDGFVPPRIDNSAHLRVRYVGLGWYITVHRLLHVTSMIAR